jgi:hypothetical protein
MPTLTLDKAALFKLVGYEPHAGQRLVHESRASRRVVACGVRWGKTTVAVHEVLSAALAPNDGGIGWVVGPSFDSVDLILVELRSLLNRRFPHRLVEQDGRERLLVIQNLAGNLCTIIGKSADHLASLLGESVAWMIIDEAARLRRDAWEEALSQRLIDTDGWALVLSTPRSTHSWFHDLYALGRGTDPDVESWSGPSWQNPRLDPSVIEKERSRLPEAVFAAQYGGAFVEDDQVPCTACGWPEDRGVPVVLLNPGDELGQCGECERVLGPDGRPVGRDGEFQVVDLRSGLAALEVRDVTDPE